MTASTDSPGPWSIRTSLSMPMIWTNRGSTSCPRLIEQLSEQGRLVWSTQVFNEFCWVMNPPETQKPTLSR